MLQILDYNVAIGQMPLIIRGMRNSWESWEKSDSFLDEWGYFTLGEKDKELALRLVLIGDDHGKWLRQVQVVAEIKAPEYFWKEFDTYKIGTTANSTSMMHTLGKEPFTVENICLDDVWEYDRIDYLDLLNTMREKWIKAGKKKATKEWRALLQVTGGGWLYTRTVSLNYQVLRHMYHARKNHRLSEWHEFCRWIEQLPYSLFITKEKTEK